MFDAMQARSPGTAAGYAIVIVLGGLLLDFGLRPWLQHKAAQRSLHYAAAVIKAFRGQFVFWAGIGAGLIIWIEFNNRIRPSGLTLSFLSLAMTLAITMLAVQISGNLLRAFLETLNVGQITLLNYVIAGFGLAAGFAVFMALNGYSLTPLFTLLASSGLGLAIVLRDPIANIFAGLTLVTSNKIRPGNFVRLSSGEEGYISDIGWYDTSIRQLSNTVINVPNSLLASATVTNFDKPDKEVAVIIEVGVSFDSDLALVERVTIEVANEVQREVSGGVKSWTTVIRYTRFDEYRILFNVIMRSEEYADSFMLRHEFVKRLHERYQQEGIIIPFPTRTLQGPEAPERDGVPARSQMQSE